MKKNVVYVITGLVVILGAVGFTLVKNKKEIDSKKQLVDRSNIAIPVTITKALIAPTESNFTLPSVTQAESETDVIVSAQGKLVNLNIQLGSVVSKGQEIGMVDTKQKELNMQSVLLTEAKLKADYERYGDLLQGKAITETNYNDIKYNYENTKIQLDQIKQQIADATITAPASGVVIRKNLEEGEFVNPGTPIATIVDVSKLKATVLVSEKDVYRLKKGAAVKITSDIYPDKVFNGTIRYISPQGDDSHNYPVEITLSNNGSNLLKAGTFIRVEFETEKNTTALQIPKIALVEGTKNPYVFTIANGTANMKKLVLGREIGENVEVVSGLEEGEDVITSGQINLTQGSKVELLNQ